MLSKKKLKTGKGYRRFILICFANHMDLSHEDASFLVQKNMCFSEQNSAKTQPIYSEWIPFQRFLIAGYFAYNKCA